MIKWEINNATLAAAAHQCGYHLPLDDKNGTTSDYAVVPGFADNLFNSHWIKPGEHELIPMKDMMHFKIDGHNFYSRLMTTRKVVVSNYVWKLTGYLVDNLPSNITGILGESFHSALQITDCRIADESGNYVLVSSVYNTEVHLRCRPAKVIREMRKS